MTFLSYPRVFICEDVPNRNKYNSVEFTWTPLKNMIKMFKKIKLVSQKFEEKQKHIYMKDIEIRH